MQKYRAHFDYQYLLRKVSKGKQVIFAYAYTTDRGDSKQQGFQRLLRKFGYHVKLVEYRECADAKNAIGNCTQEVVQEMVQLVHGLDRICLVSGNGAYEPVVRGIQAKHSVSIDIYGVPDLTSAHLIQAATRFIPIADEYLLAIPERW